MEQGAAGSGGSVGRIHVETAPGRADVALSGEIDLLVVGDLRSCLHDLLVDGHVDLAIDLSAVTFMDSSGLGTLVMAQREARVYRGSVVLVSPSPIVTRVLALTSLDKVFDVRQEPTSE